MHCIVIAVQKSCMHASAVAVFVEWWIVVFVDIMSIHRGISTYGAIFKHCARNGRLSFNFSGRSSIMEYYDDGHTWFVDQGT